MDLKSNIATSSIASFLMMVGGYAALSGTLAPIGVDIKFFVTPAELERTKKEIRAEFKVVKDDFYAQAKVALPLVEQSMLQQRVRIERIVKNQQEAGEEIKDWQIRRLAELARDLVIVQELIAKANE